MAHRSLWSDLCDAGCRLALRLYHPNFRERFGGEILRLHDRLDGDSSTPRDELARFLLVLLEALYHGPATRLEHRRQRRSRRLSAPGILSMDCWRLDLRHVIRQLSRRPLESLLLVATLALAIGAGTAIFSLVDQVLLRPLPFAEPERLVRFWGSEHGQPDDNGTIAYLDLFDWHERSHAFEAVAAYDEWSATLTGSGEPTRLIAATVSANFFDLLGVEPQAGRFFRPEEDFDGHDSVVVLSHGFWLRRFAGAKDIVGQSLLLNDRPHIVVGVAPAIAETGLAADLSEVAELWRPNGYLGLALDKQPNRGSESWAGIGRLRDGVSLERAEADLTAVAAQLEEEFPDSNYGRGVLLRPLAEHIVGDTRPSLVLLTGAVGLLFLVALVNVAGVLLGRSAARLHETALRAALGAERWALVRRDLTEGLVLSALGCLIALPVAWAGTRALVAILGHTLPRPVAVTLDGRVLSFAIAASLLAGVCCSLPPSLLLLRRAFVDHLRNGAAAVAGSRLAMRTRGAFVAIEVALSLALLVGAVILGLGLWDLRQIDPGVESENLLTFQLSPSRASYADAVALEGLYNQLIDRLGALPGVESVALTNIVPLSGDFDGNGVWADDWPEKNLENEISAQTRTISADYFTAMGIEVERGRTFAAHDNEGEAVAIINQELAYRLWPQVEAVGRFLRSSADESRVVRVVGVVENVKHLRLEADPPPRAYFPRSQGLVVWQLRRATVVLRTQIDPLSEDIALPAAIRATISDLDANLPIANLTTMSQLVERNVTSPRLRSTLSLVFALTALMLTAVGIYAVISHTVNSRLKEMAIRMALGAGRARIIAEVLRQTLALVGFGLAVGGILSLLVARLLEGFLYSSDSSRALAFALVPATLIAVSAVIAALAPALRASRVQPTSALRDI